MLVSDIITTPFSYYKTFVIEEQFGFNKTTTKTFILDKLKGLLMMAIIGGGIIAIIIWFYQITGNQFWLYAWGIVTVFTVFMNMFYSRLIVPMFNKQTPLEEGDLRNKISEYANSVGFSLNKIFIIDGSKRSTKANAYFSGFGSEKRVTLYDTLVNDLEEEEIVAVLAHEVGSFRTDDVSGCLERKTHGWLVERRVPVLALCAVILNLNRKQPIFCEKPRCLHRPPPKTKQNTICINIFGCRYCWRA